ncbi:ABC transporter ATP-binding protein [Paenibacillus sp. LjRoot153]|uniref:ABC transporter ATP-binding protein n=1 Tax=Paenibacillus sp. LjRoot153 TaxID=3342270 RepID=UPI003ECD50DD
MKPKHVQGTIRRLFKYLRRYSFSLWMIMVTAVLGTSFQIVAPMFIGSIVTELFNGTVHRITGTAAVDIDLTFIARMLLSLTALYLFSSLFGYLQQYLAGQVAQRTIYDMRMDLNEKFAKLPLRFYDSRTQGELLSRAVNDVDNVSNTLQQVVSQFLSSAVMLIGVVIMMLTVSPWLTLAILLTLPLSYFGIKAITSRSKPYFMAMQRTLGELNGHVEETYSGHAIVKTYGNEHKNIEVFKEKNAQLYQSGKMAQFISGIMMPLMSIINNLSYIIICILGGSLVIRGMMTIGNVQAFIQYSRSFSQPLMQVANIANIVQSGLSSAERIFEILDETEETPELSEPVVISKPKGEVSFDHVQFSYQDDIPLIEEMNIHVKQGETVAIVGPTGAGKSTLVNLLMRFYEVGDGRITIDGNDITKMSRGGLRGLFGMVLQDTWLFTGSIKENIAFGKPGATEEEIEEAARFANADAFIRNMPEGYDAMIHEGGDSLSQGQKQLLTIARAILADPVILLLDEATSSVDTRTEVHIQKAMQGLMEGRTSFVIAHRLSTIRDADLILVMDKGKIIEHGTHEQLLERQGFYSDLYYSQFESAPA